MRCEKQKIVEWVLVEVHVEVFENVDEVEWQPADAKYPNLMEMWRKF
jgi:hypothetical protein